jgi:hypothetical protein
MNGMNIAEFMREHPNMKIKRNKKVNYRSYAGSDSNRGQFKGIQSNSMLRDKKAMNGLIFNNDQD